MPNRIIIIVAAVQFACLSSCIRPVAVEENHGSAPLFIQFRGVQIGVLPDIGGTIVLFSDYSGENILKSERPLWYKKASEMPSMNPQREPLPVNGHTIWPGPQEDWWRQQRVDPRLRRKAPSWPPDPYLTMGRYKILERTDSSVTLQSPESPFTGIRLIKKVTVMAPGKVQVYAKATNIRNTPVSWDLWFNTRLDGHAVCYVPVTGIDGIKKIDESPQSKPVSIFYTLQDGFFTYLSGFTPSNPEGVWSKAYLIPTEPYIAAFTGNFLFIKRFPVYNDDQMHPSQAPAEIYNALFPDAARNLLELEHHSAYRALQPGESIEDYEQWELYPYKGSNDTREQIGFLKSLNGK